MRTGLWTRRRGIQPPALQIYAFIHANSSCFYPSPANMSQKRNQDLPSLRPANAARIEEEPALAAFSPTSTWKAFSDTLRLKIQRLRRLRAQKEPRVWSYSNHQFSILELYKSWTTAIFQTLHQRFASFCPHILGPSKLKINSQPIGFWCNHLLRSRHLCLYSILQLPQSVRESKTKRNIVLGIEQLFDTPSLTE